MTFKKSFGQRIRELRDAKDLSLRELARRLEVSAPFLSDVELGRRHPSDLVLEEMARVLGTTVQDLREYDSRAPVDELKRLSSEDPAFGFAFRKLVDKEVDPEELIKFLNKQPDKRKRK